MKGVKCGLAVFFLSFFCLATYAVAEDKQASAKVESFILECSEKIDMGYYGIASVHLDLGKEMSCSLILDNNLIGLPHSAGNKLLLNLRDAPSPHVVVSPQFGETDGNGRLKFNITATKRGTAWVAWTVADEKGEFVFSKGAIKKGLAVGLFVKVK